MKDYVLVALVTMGILLFSACLVYLLFYFLLLLIVNPILFIGIWLTLGLFSAILDHVLKTIDKPNIVEDVYISNGEVLTEEEYDANKGPENF